MRKFILEHKRAVGDVLVLSALVRDLALAYPNQYAVDVCSSLPELWLNNPYITKFSEEEIRTDVEQLKLDYRNALLRIGKSNKHFLCAFHDEFEAQTNIHVPLLYPRPDYHLSEEEKKPPVSGRYWVVLSGGKSDFVTKHWIYRRWQQVVNILRNYGLRFVQVGGVGVVGKTVHFHPRLENTLCLAGFTTVRDMARLIYHAEGVICNITGAMHIAAALEKPCVVIGGGREEWWWIAYTAGIGNFGAELREDVRISHKHLHTIGLLDCCKQRGCWKDNLDVDSPVCCKYPLDIDGQIAPKCMDMISTEHVIEAVMSYYENGTLPPIKTPKKTTLFIDEKAFLVPYNTEIVNINSALSEALSIPEPQLLVETEAMKRLRNKPQ